MKESSLSHSSKILMLQGPVGPFFRILATELRSRGNEVWKINFNLGDDLFFFGNCTFRYKGTFEDWESYLESKIKDLNIDFILLFGDCRTHHIIACKLAKKMKIKVWTFEEGYIRPDYVTVDEGGTNAFSSLPRNILEYKKYSRESENTPIPVGSTFFTMGLFASLYFCALSLSRLSYPFYTHHKSQPLYNEVTAWLRSGVRKLIYKSQQKNFINELIKKNDKNYFVVPLQVHNDMQISYHSDYKDISFFIKDVIESFKRCSLKEKILVFKHHPMDRGYRDYSSLIKEVSESFDCSDRVFYVHDVHLPTLLKHSLGIITINSTTALSSLYHGIPVLALGRAFYRIDGITFDRNLDDFWCAPGKVRKVLFRTFRKAIIDKTQVNGSFYGKYYHTDVASKVADKILGTNIALPTTILKASEKSFHNLPKASYRNMSNTLVIMSGNKPN